MRGAVSLPGSKSITNRALLLAALCDRPVTLLDPLVSEDTRLMAEALQALGLDVRREGDRPLLRVQGAGGAIPAPSADLFVGLAGTVARFLPAWCASAAAGTYRIDGTAAMRRRPAKPPESTPAQRRSASQSPAAAPPRSTYATTLP